MPKYKAVIFDFDDTLVESRVQKWAHHKHVAKSFYNIDLTEEKIREHWGKPLNTLIDEIYKKSDTVENILKSLVSVRDKFKKKTYAGAVETVSHLLENDIKVGVVSATNQEFLLNGLDEGGFTKEKMFFLQGADDTDFHKPDPKVFSPLLDELKNENISSDQVVYVGDSINDFLAAHGAGMDFIAVTTGLYSEEDFKKAGAKVIIKDIKELLKEIL